MISAEQLSEEQKATIRGWVEQGAQLADLQKKLGEEFQENVTYMATRFLALDLGLEFKSEVEEEPEPAAEEPEVYEIPEDATAGGFDEEPAAEPLPMDPLGAEGGPVDVTLDTVGRPGAMVSGTVRFPDGQKATWLVDQMGRLSLDPDTAGYRPSEPDLMSFQKELQSQLERM